MTNPDATTLLDRTTFGADRRTAALHARAPRELVSGRGLIILAIKAPPNARDVFRKWPQAKQGVLFRSAALDKSDVPWLEDRGIKTIFDLRPSGSNPKGPWVTHRIPVVNKGAHGPMELAYVTKYAARFAELTTAIAEALAVGPVLYHCAAGKDRTGWESTCIMRHVGVSMPVVKAEYLASHVVGKVNWQWEVNVYNLAKDWAFTRDPLHHHTIGGYLRGGGVTQASLDALVLRLAS